jgi:hypothetical protein
LVDFGGTRGDPSFGNDYPNAGTGQIFMLVPSVPGDYNDDGVVNAADYTVWRNHFGQNYVLPNEVPGVTPGVVTGEDYNEWKARFGDSLSGAGASGARTVPEPSGFYFSLIAAIAYVGFLSRAVRREPRPPSYCDCTVSPPARVDIARQTMRSTSSLTVWPEPSAIATWTPPGW